MSVPLDLLSSIEWRAKVCTPLAQPEPIDSEEILTEVPVIEEAGAPTVFHASEEDTGVRLDHYLVARIPNVSRVRVQQLVEQGKVLVNERPAKASLKLKGNEQIEITGTVEAAPLKAFAEDIPLTVVFEDKELAVVNKPAGMVVHASSGSAEDARNRGTLVNALLFRFNKLSEMGGELRPGIVHRLDKDTSGLIVVAKNDVAHRKLVEQFSSRQVHKTYIALVHNWPKTDDGYGERSDWTRSAQPHADEHQRHRSAHCGFALQGGGAPAYALWALRTGRGAD